MKERDLRLTEESVVGIGENMEPNLVRQERIELGGKIYTVRVLRREDGQGYYYEIAEFSATSKYFQYSADALRSGRDAAFKAGGIAVILSG